MMAVTFILLMLCGVMVSAQSPIQFSVKEELQSEALVGNIGDASNMRVNYTTEEFNSIRFKFLEQTSTQTQTRFRINEINGDLFAAANLDREVICGFKEHCVLSLEVAAYSNMITLFKILSVDVVLVDDNDNSPRFSSNNITISVLESSVVGSPVTLEQAVDLDSTQQNSIKSYHLIPENYAVFGLNVTSKTNGFSLKIVLLKPLDRETQDSYQFKVIAKDGGVPPNTGTLTVNVVVTDYNDHSPEFSHETYDVSVNEGVAIHTTILTVSAKDQDINENAKISYNFNSRQSDLNVMNSLFDLDPVTGQITVIGNLVYENGKVYNILVEAKDHGEPSRVGTATVLVSVLDVGNNPPTASINFLTSNVSEAANLKTVIAHINVIDTDSGDNGKVTCTISSLDFGLKEMPPKGYIVIVNRTLNREKQDKYDITITCKDRGVSALESSVNFTVRILDENDNAPRFKEDTYFAFVEENSDTGRVIKQVAATDADQGRNSIVYYYLDDDAEGRFAINSNTGVITTNAEFDREDLNSYTFTVLAVDSGNPPLTGSATLVLTVTDVNDHAPLFDVDSFQFFVFENKNPDTYVGTLSANDKDEGDNKKIAFSIIPQSGSPDNFPFLVLPNGVIQTTTILNREKDPVYEFYIVATDKGTPPLSSSTRVVVRVADENDNAPVIMFPNNSNNSVTVSFLASVGSQIFRVKAFDLDEEGPNSRLVYSIVAGNPLDVFSIGSISGNVYLKRTYPIDEDMPFRLKISVKDSGQEPRETLQDLNILLKYSNESAVTAMPQHGNTNIIITVVVVILTVIISVVIIATICILRRHDKQLEIKDSEKSFEKSEIVPSGDKEVDILNDNISLDTPRKKKKEVSFSFDEAYDSMHQEFGSNVFPDHQKTENPDQMYNKVNKDHNQLKSLQLHQLHLQAHAGQAQINCDAGSDTSCESTNTDSGKGGSDVDLSCQINSTDELSTFNYFKKPFKKPNYLMPSSLPQSRGSKSKSKKHTKHNHHGNRHFSSGDEVFHTNSDLNTQTSKDSRQYNSHGDFTQNSTHDIPDSSSPPEKWVPPSYV